MKYNKKHYIKNRFTYTSNNFNISITGALKKRHKNELDNMLKF